MVKFGVYYWLCRPTGKMYIGSSIDTLARETAHRNMLNSGTHHSLKLQNAWNKYGELAFEFDLLDPEVCFSDLREAEARLIKFHDTYRNGYNQTTATGKLEPLPKDHREKLSIAAKKAGTNPTLRKLRSERAKAQHAAGKLGRTTWNPETSEIVANKLRGRKRPDASIKLIGNTYAKKNK